MDTQEKNGFHKPGTWLILADSQGVGKTLAELLHSRGHTCIWSMRMIPIRQKKQELGALTLLTQETLSAYSKKL
ncbi:MAG: hypothetical protein F6K28_61985 [Microcoleus sp. SIO2G3]|nr:hypothetical protein [Microcoleus sp. SIO2G3]